MHRVAVLALDGVVPLNLAIACDVFGRHWIPDRPPPYTVEVCGEHPAVSAGSFSIAVPHDLAALERAETVLVPGLQDIRAPVSAPVVAALRAAAARGARVASLCSGSFILAAAGLLDGLRATTHWLAAAELARRHPRVTVEPDVLFVDNGAILTSAGAAAGLDLCLHIVRADHGVSVAARYARLAVMPLQREGSSAQHIVPPPTPAEPGLEPVLQWMWSNLRAPLTLKDIAAHAAMSTRTLSRRFREQVGCTPTQWLLDARVRRAQQLLETTALPVQRIADEVGFGSPSALRDRFLRRRADHSVELPPGLRRAAVAGHRAPEPTPLTARVRATPTRARPTMSRQGCADGSSRPPCSPAATGAAAPSPWSSAS